MEKKIEWSVYQKLKDVLTKRLVENINDEEALELYRGITGSKGLSDVYSEIMFKEIESFIEDTKKEQGNSDFGMSIDDYGYADGAFYIRIWVAYDERAYGRLEAINEFFSNASERTKIMIRPEYILYNEIIPSSDSKEIPEKIQPKIHFPNMYVELNEIK